MGRSKVKVNWCYGDEAEQAPYHYTGCGLDNIYLLSGFELHETPYGGGVSIKNVQKLHAAIGAYLCERKKLLSGQELRFIRTEMDLTQSELGRLLGCSSQQIARYEKEQSAVTGPADRLIRMIYKEHAGGNVRVRDLLETIDEMDGRHTDKQLFSSTADGWQAAA